jgi:MFS transporter, DHA1 family, tetracycline resistance protein
MSDHAPAQQPTLDFSRVLPIFVLVFVDVLGLTVILPLLHLYGAAYNATPLQIGLVAAAFPLSQLIGVPIMGALSDQYGRKPLLLISQISTCISFIMLGTAQSLEMIVLSRVVDGIFGANLATAQAALSDITDSRTRTQGLGLTGAAFGLGFIFGPIISILSLEMTGSLSIPALSAAGYSFISILLTWLIFEETLPANRRRSAESRFHPVGLLSLLTKPGITPLIFIMFMQQLIFFGFETLLGLFVLSRLGLLGQANAIIFIIIGITLVIVQTRFLGKWARRYGERRLALLAILLLAGGLLLIALTPDQPQPFYVRRNVEYDLRSQMMTSTEAVLGDMNISLPDEENRGIGGVLWVALTVIPLSVGAALIRPSINSLLTRQVSARQYGSVLGLSASAVSAANAIAPLLGGWIFQQYGADRPFLWGGFAMAIVLAFSLIAIKDPQPPSD